MNLASSVLRSTYVSYSRLESFRKCPLQFKLVYLDGHPSTSSRAADLGKLVHEVIAAYLRSIQGEPTVHTPTSRILTDLVRNVSKQLLDSEEISFQFTEEEVLPLVETFAQKFPRIDGRAIAEVESVKMTRIGSWKFKSILDLILVKSDGRRSIIDFKTGKPQYVTRRQLRTYALPVLGSPKYQHSEVHLSYVFLRDGTIKQFSMEREQCQGVVNSLIEAIEGIEACAEFVAKPSPLCEWCGVRNVCPAYRNWK